MPGYIIAFAISEVRAMSLGQDHDIKKVRAAIDGKVMLVDEPSIQQNQTRSRERETDYHGRRMVLTGNRDRCWILSGWAFAGATSHAGLLIAPGILNPLLFKAVVRLDNIHEIACAGRDPNKAAALSVFLQ